MVRFVPTLLVVLALSGCGGEPSSAPSSPAASARSAPVERAAASHGANASAPAANPGAASASRSKSEGASTASPTASASAPPAGASAAPSSSTAPAPIASGESAPAVCDAQRANAPCLFLLQGKCFIHNGPNASFTPVTCPNPPPSLVGDACQRTDMCLGVSDEGCCIGCTNPMRTRISPACAQKLEKATSCAAANLLLKAKGCLLH